MAAPFEPGFESFTKSKTLRISKGLALFNFSVTLKGFEPPTNRTGICHSIQLNYKAYLFVMRCKFNTFYTEIVAVVE